MNKQKAMKLAATIVGQFHRMVGLHNRRNRPGDRVTEDDLADVAHSELEEMADAIVAVLTDSSNRLGFIRSVLVNSHTGDLEVKMKIASPLVGGRVREEFL